MRPFFTAVPSEAKTVKNRNAKPVNAATVTYGPHAAPGNLMRFLGRCEDGGKNSKTGWGKNRRVPTALRPPDKQTNFPDR